MNNLSENYLGPCLFYDQLIMERNYTLYQNGTWTVFQECTNSRIQFNTRCGSSGSWTTDMKCLGMSDTTSTQGEPETNSTQGEPETTSTRGESE